MHRTHTSLIQARVQSKRQLRAEQEARKQDLYQKLSALREALLQQIDALKLPTNPLDTLIDELGGTEAVAEMTGGIAVQGGAMCGVGLYAIALQFLVLLPCTYTRPTCIDHCWLHPHHASIRC